MPVKTIDDREICESMSSAEVQPLPSGVEPGARVSVRGGRWRVDAAVAHTDCRTLYLSDTASSRGSVLLWPFDRPVPVQEGQRRGLKVVRLRRWRRVVATIASGELTPDTPRVISRADILPYQLAPAIAVARGAFRVLLADDVGLGKTIQAGWIAADCLARRPDARMLAAVPAGVRRQWESELRRLFGMEPIIADAAWLRRSLAALPADMSPWTPPGLYLASIDFLKRPDLASSLDTVTWDVLIVDEAHTAAAPTDRHAIVERIAARARVVAALTATPYSGDLSGFRSIVTLGGGGPEPPILFRRSRRDIGDRRRRRHRFATIALTDREQRLQRSLERYTREVWRESGGDGDSARLAMTILRKRALSSAAAALESLVRRLHLLQGRTPQARQLSLLDDDDGLERDDAVPDATLGAPGLRDADREHMTLRRLIECATRAASTESKIDWLRRFLRRVNGEPVIIFTEYRDTLVRLSSLVEGALQLHGGLPASERVTLQQRFNAHGGVLLATDAASCGLNLHERCRVVVNFELPWNPARLEQRIGRVDRIGQRRTVHAVTLVARDTAEALVIAPLVRRLFRVAATLGERDRLTSFLTDARTAGIVMGSAPEPSADEAPAPSLPEAPELEPVSIDVAARLTAAASAAYVRSDGDPIVASAMRASPLVGEGIAVVIETTAATDAGDLSGRRVVVLHRRG
ncbi:MAG: DEAD/DEAH box helicase, partial [Vicinamibacterales bacterium]